jgi:hypothetical protein
MNIIILLFGFLHVIFMCFLASFMQKELNKLSEETQDEITKIPAWRISIKSLFVMVLGLTLVVAIWIKFRNASILAFYVFSIIFVGFELLNYRNKLNQLKAPSRYINAVAEYQYLWIMNYAVFLAFLSFLRQIK